jgi:transmembrane sensor
MDDQIYIIVAKVLDGEASQEERQELDTWLSADPKNRAAYEDMKAVWHQSDLLFQTPVFDAAAAWSKVSPVIEQTKPVTPKGRVISFPAWASYSMAAAAVLLIGLFIFRQWNGQEITIAALDGDKHIILPDNSVVDLRKGSNLSYPRSFASNERKVELTGEAYFDIVHKEDQTFVLNAQSVNVKVLGTSFMVSCDKGKALVAVTSGSVQMTSRTKAGAPLVLKKGEKGTIVNGRLVKQNLTDENFLYWKTGLITFADQPLEQVVAEMSSLTGRSIQLKPDMQAVKKQQLVNISFHDQSLEDMLTDLCLIAGCQWSGDSTSYIIGEK